VSSYFRDNQESVTNYSISYDPGGTVLLGAGISWGRQMSNDPCQMINAKGPVTDIVKKMTTNLR